MIILHIAAIENNPFNGVCIAAPQHAIAQSQYAQIGFINIKRCKINVFTIKDKNCKNNVVTQLEYETPFRINQLPPPFNTPDLVVFHECYRSDYLFISKELNKRKIPYIDIPHGELGKNAQQKKRVKKLLANFLLFNSFIKKAIGIQCLSKREYEETLLSTKKFISTNGVCTPSSCKEKFNTNNTKFIYIGRLDIYHKGLDLLIKAVGIAKEFMRKQNVSLDIYGPDIYGRFEALQSLVLEENVSDIISLHHEITGIEKESTLLNADIFIQTSRFEGMPLGILEALSYGLPCLITEGTTLGETVLSSNSGWVCKTSADDIAVTIKKAVENKKFWKEKSNNARNLIKADFSWEIISQKTIECYTSLLRKK